MPIVQFEKTLSLCSASVNDSYQVSPKLKNEKRSKKRSNTIKMGCFHNKDDTNRESIVNPIFHNRNRALSSGASTP